MYAHFAQHVDSGVCKIRTLYDSYSLQKKNRLKQINIFIDSNEALNKLFGVSQKDLMNSITNDKSREQALSSNAVGYLGRSCKYVCSRQNLDKTERPIRIPRTPAARKLNNIGA